MKMKQVWSSPKTSFEQFVPQNYIAACGDSGKEYFFTCDGGGGADGGVWEETNNIPGLQSTGQNADKRISRGEGSYSACKKTHTASADSDFIFNCYFKKYQAKSLFDDTNITPDSEAINVVVWRGPEGNNTHCTANLDINSWETTKS